MDFFEQFNQAKREFTYGDYEDMDRNNLQVGLVATFYIDQCYLPHKRQGLADALKLYYQHFGQHFKWYYFGDRRPQQPDEKSFEQCCQYIVQEEDDAVEFMWSSETSALLHVGDYKVASLSMQDWFEQVHKDLSYFSFYLPVEELKGEGKALFETLLLECCRLLQPIHGSAGLGMQVCYESEEFQDLEYEVAQEFTGIDVGALTPDKELRTGFKTINWYTILSTPFVDKLGGTAGIKKQMNDERIALLPFDTGLMVRAGEWPELGWVRQNPYPELYVKVNNVLKPARAPEVQSFHFGSIEDEVRFDPKTSNEWLKRFDEPKPIPSPLRVVE